MARLSEALSSEASRPSLSERTPFEYQKSFVGLTRLNRIIGDGDSYPH